MQVEVGCWVETLHGPAVCVMVTPGWVGYRYRARRVADKKVIWVATGGETHEVSFLRPASGYSKRIARLKGPYGEG